MDRTTSSKPLVTYHVGEPSRVEIALAGADRDISLQQAEPPRVAEWRPTQPAKPVRRIDGRVSIPSVRSFVRLAACLLGVFHGVKAEALGPTPAFPADQLREHLGGLDDAVRLLGKMGVETFFVAQGDEADHASLSSMNAVLDGLIRDSGSATLLQHDLKKAASSAPGAYGQAVAKAISKNAEQIGDDPHGRFADLMSTRRVDAYSASKDETGPRYLGVLGDANERAPSVVMGLSKEFAFYLHAGPNTLRFPGGSATVPVTRQYELAEPQLANQQNAYGLFQAALNLRRSALIVTTNTVTPAEVEMLWDHFNGQYAVCMVPLEDDVQAMIVAPPDARSGLIKLLKELADRGVEPVRLPPDDSAASQPPESAQAMLCQLIQENIVVICTVCTIAGVCVLVYKCAKTRDKDARTDRSLPRGPRTPDRSVAKQKQSKGRMRSLESRERAMAPFDERSLTYTSTPGGALVPPNPGKIAASLASPSPENIAASVTQEIRELQAAKESGKAGVNRYLQQKGVELRALLDPETGGGAEAAANAAFQLSGVIESTLMNQTQMRRWMESEGFMDGVTFNSVLQTVKDHRQQEPQNEMLAKAVAMLQAYSRLVPTGDSDEREFKGRQGPAPRPGLVRARNTRANAASASNDAATPSPVTIANIFAFGKELAAEVSRGGDMNGVRIGKDIYIPSAVIVPHWHLNENFVVYKHSDTNHIEVARGADFYPERAGSVGMRLDDTIARDHQLLRIQTFILTGNKIA